MYPRKRTAPARYYVCSTKYVSASCDGIGAVQASNIEDIVFDEMRRKLAEFTELSVKERQGDPIELTKLKVRADEIEKEIATLIDKVVSASSAMIFPLNSNQWVRSFLAHWLLLLLIKLSAGPFFVTRGYTYPHFQFYNTLYPWGAHFGVLIDVLQENPANPGFQGGAFPQSIVRMPWRMPPMS